MHFSPDYTEITESIPPGIYAAKIVGFEQRMSKNNTPMIAWDLEITSSDDFVGAQLIHYTVLRGPGAAILKRFLRAADPSYSCGDFYPESYLGKQLVVVLAEGRMPDGRPGKYPRVIDTNPLPVAALREESNVRHT